MTLQGQLQDHPDFVGSSQNLSEAELRLIAAARHGDADAVMHLLDSIEQQCLAVNAKDQLGRTATSYAAGNGHLTVLQMLLAVRNIDVNAKGLH